MIHLKELIVCLALPALFIQAAQARELPPAATVHGEAQYGHGLFFRFQGATLAADKDKGLELSVDGRTLDIGFSEEAEAGVAEIREDGVLRSVPYSLDPHGHPAFPLLGQEDPFLRFYRGLPAGSQARVDDLKRFVASYASLHAPSRTRHELTDCENWTIFTLQMFVDCPGSYGLGCLAGAYGIYKMFKTCR